MVKIYSCVNEGLNLIYLYQLTVCIPVELHKLEIMRKFWAGKITVYMDHAW